MMEPYSDTYASRHVIYNFGAGGGVGDILIGLDPGDEIIEIAFMLLPASAEERLTNQTLTALDNIGNDAESLADAQASLGITAPVDEGGTGSIIYTIALMGC